MKDREEATEFWGFFAAIILLAAAFYYFAQSKAPEPIAVPATPPAPVKPPPRPKHRRGIPRCPSCREYHLLPTPNCQTTQVQP